MKSLRILHLCPSLAPGGAQRQLCYLSRELGNRGHDVHIAARDLGPNFELVNGAKNVSLHVLGKGRPILEAERSIEHYNPAVLARVLALVRSVRPDVAQTWLPQMDIIGGIAAKISGVPWVLREPNSARAYSGCGLKASLRKRLGRTASVIVANSSAGSHYWASIGSLNARVVIRNGVPLGELERTPRLNHSAIPCGVPLILCASRFEPNKNVVRTFQAMVDAVSHSNAKAIICGSGPLQPRLHEILGRVPDASRVEIWPYQTELWPLMKSADVFVSASFNEGSPNCVLEAMACRCPLAVSDIPEHREFLSEESAEFVDPRSADSICRGIETVLRERALTRARVEQAYSDVSQFSLENMVSRYEALYHSLERGSLTMSNCLPTG